MVTGFYGPRLLTSILITLLMSFDIRPTCEIWTVRVIKHTRLNTTDDPLTLGMCAVSNHSMHVIIEKC